MRRLLVILVALALGAVAAPVQRAEAQAFADAECTSLVWFQLGCNVSGGPWSETFADYAEENGISNASNVGARVRYFGQGADPLEEVMYIVGPYLAAVDEAGDLDSVLQERAVVESIAPVMDPVNVRLRDLGVSIVYIGFGSLEDSQQPVAQRVEAVKTTVRTFENFRRARLGHDPHATALMGLSLGGVAGKIALRELEMEGFDHGVDTYVSFDSPHWGAYTPLSIQNIPIFMQGAFRWAERGFSWSEALFDNPLDDARDGAGQVTNLTLRSPVAQDLLIFNRAYDNWESPNSSYIRDRYTWLPQGTSRNVAIASGSITGAPSGVGADYFTFDTGKGDVLDFRLEMQVKAPTVDAPRYFYGKLSHDVLFGNIHYRRRPDLHSNIIENFERGSCAFSSELVNGVAAGLEAAVNSAGLWNNLDIAVTSEEACFIPTFSAVIGDYSSANGAPAGVTRFDHVIGNAANKEHLAVSGNMTNELLSELDRVFAGTPAPQPAPQPTPTPQPTPEPTPQPTPQPPSGGCDFWSGTHNLDETRAMFPAQCGEQWNDQIHFCDYTDQGWHCMDQANSGGRTEPQPTPEPTPQPTPQPPSGGCDFWSGTHNLDETRAMFPAQCGEQWNDQIHFCDYTDQGWHCMDIANR